MVREMIRVGSFSIPGNIPIRIGLTYIYGVGKGRGPKAAPSRVLQRAKVDFSIKGKDLSDEQKVLINQELEKFTNGESLKQEKEENIKRLIRIICYRGKHQSMNKKDRGQSTRRNNRTRPYGIDSKKKPRAAVAGKKKATRQEEKLIMNQRKKIKLKEVKVKK